MSKRRGFITPRASWAIPILGVLTLYLGYTGWTDMGVNGPEALYRAVTLFDLGNGNYGDPEGFQDLRFTIGRWTALATLFGAAIIALAVILKERAALAVARWVTQDVVVIGGDGIATKAFEAAKTARQSVLWVGASSLGANSIKAIALPWPPDDRAATVIDHTGDAEHILIAEDDDATALVLTRAARVGAPGAYITVLMRDTHLAQAAAATLNSPLTRVMSTASISARALMIDHPPFLIAREKKHAHIHALIIGFGQTGQGVLRELIVNCRTTYLDLPRITVIDPDAKALEGVGRVQAPELDDCAVINFIPGRIGSRSINPDPTALAEAIEAFGPVTAAYVCLNRDDDALAAAAMLQSLLRAADIEQPTMFVRLREAAVVVNAPEDDIGLNALIPFGGLAQVLNDCEFLDNTPDSAARSFSQAYRASLTQAERDDVTNRSARPWEELNETFRQANRDAVAHIPAKLASAGIDPTAWVGVRGLPKPPAGTALFDGPQTLERLAELEHERWNAQRRMDGWRWTANAKKDEARRLHPSLVTYEELTDEVKEFDRVYIRQTQLNVWGVG